MYYFKSDGIEKFDPSSDTLALELDLLDAQDTFLIEVFTAYQQEETDKYSIFLQFVKYFENNKYIFSGELSDQDVLINLMDISILSPELQYYALCSILKLIEYDVGDHFSPCVLNNFEVTSYLIQSFKDAASVTKDCIINFVDVMCLCAHKTGKLNYLEIIPYQFVYDIFEYAGNKIPISLGVSRIIKYLSSNEMYPQLIPFIHDTILQKQLHVDALIEYTKAYLYYSQFFPDQIDFSEKMIAALQYVMPRDCFLLFLAINLKYIDLLLDPQVILSDLSSEDPSTVKSALKLIRAYLVYHDDESQNDTLETFIKGFYDNGGLEFIHKNMGNKDFAETLIILLSCVLAQLSEENIWDICQDKEIVDFFIDGFDDGVTDYLLQIALLGGITALVKTEAMHGATYIADLISQNRIDEIAINWVEKNPDSNIDGDVASMLNAVREILELEDE